MSNANGSPNDPSMDDILASIRKIISDDEARGREGKTASPIKGGTASSSSPAEKDDVLLLTELADEPKADFPLPSSALALPRTKQPAAPVPASTASTTPNSALEHPVTQSRSHKGLVEPVAAELAASALERLSPAVLESAAQPAAPDPGPAMSGRNLDDVVKELLRPMMKEWLDKNLPALVERYVELEIVRLTRR